MGSDRSLVVVVGDINADIALTMAEMPAVGHDGQARSLRWGSGGGGVNASVAFRALGAPVRLVGRVGADPAGDVALRCALDRGVDCSHVTRVAGGATGLCTVLVTDDGHRTFLSYRGENALLETSAVSDEVLRGATLLYVSGYALLSPLQAEAVSRAIAWCASREVPVVLDACAMADQLRDAVDLGAAGHWMLVSANEDELKRLTGATTERRGVETLRASGVRWVAVKRGPRGCSLHGPGGHVDAEAPSVAVSDTTACGDAFSAACAWALCNGATASEAARLANALGAMTARQPGAADSIPTRDAVLRELPHEAQRWAGGGPSVVT